MPQRCFSVLRPGEAVQCSTIALHRFAAPFRFTAMSCRSHADLCNSFALPGLAMPVRSFAMRSNSPLCNAFASQFPAPPILCLAVLSLTMPTRSIAPICVAFAILSSSFPCSCIAWLCKAMPCLHPALPCCSLATLRKPKPCPRLAMQCLRSSSPRFAHLSQSIATLSSSSALQNSSMPTHINAAPFFSVSSRC